MTHTALRDELAGFADKLDVPAVGGGVVSATDETFDVVGVCRRGRPDAASLDHPWHIGSCTKSITAALYARLIEQGRTTWQTSIGDLFPDLRRQIHAEWQRRTIEELFYCRAGMRANPSLKLMRASWADRRPLIEQRTTMAVQAMTQAPKRVGRFVYSNFGYMVIGAAIDRLTDGSYEQALHERLLGPLGITTLGNGAPLNIWGHSARLRLGSLLLFRGKPKHPDDPRSDNPPAFSAAGTLHLTLPDWAKFLKLFVRGGNGLLGARTIEELLSGPADYQMIKGWARASLPGTSFGVQGSNTLWATAALLSEDRDRVSLVACNDGRTRVLMQSALLAARLLEIDV